VYSICVNFWCSAISYILIRQSTVVVVVVVVVVSSDLKALYKSVIIIVG